MTDTLDQLRRRYDRPCITLAEFRQDWLPHIKSDNYLLRQIGAKRIAIRVVLMDPASRKSLRVIYLADLAKWLDAKNPNHHTAASEQAA